MVIYLVDVLTAIIYNRCKYFVNQDLVDNLRGEEPVFPKDVEDGPTEDTSKEESAPKFTEKKTYEMIQKQSNGVLCFSSVHLILVICILLSVRALKNGATFTGCKSPNEWEQRKKFG